MAYSNPSYCTSSDLRDVLPQIDEFDVKTQIFGWVETGISNQYIATNSGLVTQLFADGGELGDKQTSVGAVSSSGRWYYDSGTDSVYYFHSTLNPINMLMEAGEDFATHQTDIIQKASSYFNSRVDSNLPRQQFKDKDGEYDYLVVRTTALIACNFLIKAESPTSALIEVFEEEINFNLELINSGKAKISNQVSGDSSKGYVKEVAVVGALKIVDTRGFYTGTYDRIKVVISTGGATGSAKYDVYIKDSDCLKNNKTVDAKIITGDYQTLSGNLQIRFQGASDSSEATASDEWEIEVFGQQESLDDNIGAVKYTSMTRTNRPFNKSYRYMG